MDNALTIINKARDAGALIFAPQHLECPPLYKVEISEIKARLDEFHNMKGKFMPNRAVTDRIGEAAGVDFIASECSVSAETRPSMPEMNLPARTVFIGVAQGRTRLPDGSWRASSKVDYEFDPILRARSEGKSDREALEYMKFARQRASTGARLGVIRQLVGMPVTFTAEEVKKPLIFSRVVQNTDYVLSTPEGKAMAIAMATGAAQMMYGKQLGALEPIVHPQPEDLGPVDFKHAEDQQTGPAEDQEGDDGFDFSDDPEINGSADKPSVATEKEVVDTMITTLDEWYHSDEITDKAKAGIKDAIDRNVRDRIVLEDLLRRTKANARALKEKGVSAGKAS